MPTKMCHLSLSTIYPPQERIDSNRHNTTELFYQQHKSHNFRILFFFHEKQVYLAETSLFVRLAGLIDMPALVVN